jgi:hypothetical protein
MIFHPRAKRGDRGRGKPPLRGLVRVIRLPLGGDHLHRLPLPDPAEVSSGVTAVFDEIGAF